MSSLSLSAATDTELPLIVDVGRGEAHSIGDLQRRAAGFGALLAARGVRAGDRVTLSATNRVETAVALLAMFDRGVVAVPLHPRLSDSERDGQRRDADAALHLDDAQLDEIVHGSNDLAIAPGGLAAMLFTSGSSGRPRGALLTHGAFVASARASSENLGWAAEDRWLLTLPLCHVGGLSVLTRCLVARRPLALLPRFDPDAVLDAIVRHRTTLLSVVPTMLHALIERDRAGALRRLRAVLVGGAACPMPLREEAAARGVRCLATYGLTEACSQVATQPPTAALTARPGVGRVLSALSLRIVGEQGDELATGEVGRIHLRGDAMMQGYFGHPALGDGYFDTGDHGALDARGELFVHGRRTDLIVTGGENVYPVEVEQAVMEFSGVADAMVFGVDDPTWGQRVALLVVPRGALDEAALSRFLRGRLAGFKRPRVMAAVSSLPALPSGKPDRRAAAALHGPSLRPW